MHLCVIYRRPSYFLFILFTAGKNCLAYRNIGYVVLLTLFAPSVLETKGRVADENC